MMGDWIAAYFTVFIQYCSDIWLSLLLGFAISGVVHQFLSEKVVHKYLGKPGIFAIFTAAFIGALLPVCCIGTLPIALVFKRKRASLGAVLAFLVATPATSISAIFVTARMMGVFFAGYLFLAVLITSITLGLLAEFLRSTTYQFSNSSGEDIDLDEKNEDVPKAGFIARCKNAIYYGFVVLPKSIGTEIFIGISLATIVSITTPIQHFIKLYLTGALGYLAIVVFGLFDYVCSTASVPLAYALTKSGMSIGQSLCYLILGPVTSYATILVIGKDFGLKVLALYIFVIVFFAVVSGVILDHINFSL